MSSCWLLLKFQIWQRSKTFTQPWGWLNFSTRQLPSNRRNVICLSLYYRYIHSRCLGELQYLVLKVQTFTAMTPPPPLRHVWARAAQSSDRVQKCLRSYLAGQLFSTLQLFFRQRKRHSPLRTLSLYPWQVFGRIKILATTSSDLQS